MDDRELIMPTSALTAIGADAIAGTLDDAEIALFQGDINLTQVTTYAELETAKATYTGYAIGVVTWSAVTRSDTGSIEYLGSTAEFRPSGTSVTNMVTGVYVRNAAHSDWLFAAKFEEPIPMQSALDAIRLTLRYRPDANSLVAILS